MGLEGPHGIDAAVAEPGIECAAEHLGHVVGGRLGRVDEVDAGDQLAGEIGVSEVDPGVHDGDDLARPDGVPATTGSQTLLYSPNDNPPLIDSSEFIWVEKIAEHWYHYRTTLDPSTPRSCALAMSRRLRFIMTVDPILEVLPLGMPWQTSDPFLFCVHHDDAYPAGNERLGPAASLRGRNIGQDFAGLDGWRMYHGDLVPGFPGHPHRGFETVTIVLKGFIDHSDSLGATARFGEGDVQWLTAGKGIVHSEMFPLLDQHGPNPLELFQIWLNLPRASKMAEPHFKMLWHETIPTSVTRDGEGKRTEVMVIAGELGDSRAPAPPPDSWAAGAEADLAIWSIRMEPGARWRLPAAKSGTNRTLYYHEGTGLQLSGRPVSPRTGVKVRPDVDLELVVGPDASRLLLLQGRPIGEPVTQYGPFVMTTPAEIQEAFVEYQATEFGGWPWPEDGPVHARDAGRFARYPDGHIERPV